jgi:hypothetical protein
VFISYRRKADGETAELLFQKLNRRGIVAFYAPETLPAGSFAEHLIAKVRAAKCLILVLSPGTFSSNGKGPTDDWVQREILAAKESGTPILVLRNPDNHAVLQSIPPELGTYEEWQGLTAVDYKSDGRIDPAVEQVIRHVRHISS